MNITSTTLYQKYKRNSNVKDGNLNHLQNVPTDEAVSDYLYDVLGEKRTLKEIDIMKVKLQEKALVLEKSNRVKKKLSKRKRKLTSKQIKALNLHAIPKDGQKYQNFLPINDLWKQYVLKTFSTNSEVFEIRADDRLLKIDYHGAELSVYNSKCNSYVGLKGIVLKETKNMIILITKYNQVKTIPKKGTVFMFELDVFRVKLNGDTLVGRPGVRMTKKIKQVCQADLLIS